MGPDPLAQAARQCCSARRGYSRNGRALAKPAGLRVGRPRCGGAAVQRRRRAGLAPAAAVASPSSAVGLARPTARLWPDDGAGRSEPPAAPLLRRTLTDGQLDLPGCAVVLSRLPVDRRRLAMTCSCHPRVRDGGPAGRWRRTMLDDTLRAQNIAHSLARQPRATQAVLLQKSRVALGRNALSSTGNT